MMWPELHWATIRGPAIRELSYTVALSACTMASATISHSHLCDSRSRARRPILENDVVHYARIGWCGYKSGFCKLGISQQEVRGHESDTGSEVSFLSQVRVFVS